MKTAQELGIEQWELDALIKTRDFLRRTAPPIPDDLGSLSGFPDGTDNTRFCMNFVVQSFDCGTAMCIGGFVKVFADATIPVGDKITLSKDQAFEISRYVSRKEDSAASLYPLFYPPKVVDYNEITAYQSAAAITNFLEEGDPAWLTIEGIQMEPEEE